MKIFEIIEAIIIMLGIIFIYDARQFAKKMFSFSDQNGATLALKIIGFILNIIGGLLILLT